MTQREPTSPLEGSSVSQADFECADDATPELTLRGRSRGSSDQAVSDSPLPFCAPNTGSYSARARGTKLGARFSGRGSRLAVGARA